MSAARVAATARRLAEAGLLVGTAGNVSVRVGDRVHVTASGVRLAGATEADVVEVSLAGDVLSAGRPTTELALHLGVYADRPDVSAVVHTHAPFCTAVACVLPALPVLHYQQLLLGGEVRVAPYATFGTPELAVGVREALRDRQAALMGNHGSVTVGGSLAAAEENAVLLEWLAALHARASALGTPRQLDEKEQADVITTALARGYAAPA